MVEFRALSENDQNQSITSYGCHSYVSGFILILNVSKDIPLHTALLNGGKIGKRVPNIQRPLVNKAFTCNL